LRLLTDQARVVDGGNPEYTACLKQLERFEKYTPEELQMEGPYTMLRGTFLNPYVPESVRHRSARAERRTRAVFDVRG
jgi:hypothetical protein